MHLVKSSMSIVVAACTLIISFGVSAAGPLPKNAKPLSSAEVRSLFANHTKKGGPDSCTDRDTSIVKWFSDGRMRGISTVPAHGLDSIFWGRWTVKGNRLCAKTTVHYIPTNKSKSEYRCFDYYLAGSDIYGFMSYCPTRAYGSNDYWRVTKPVSGDLTSPAFDKLYKKYVGK